MSDSVGALVGAAEISIRSTLDRLEAAFEDLATPARRNQAYAAGINWTGARVLTVTARYVAKEDDLPVRYVRSQIDASKAGANSLRWRMKVSGGYMTLIDYAHVIGGSLTQNGAGVVAPRWGLHRHAFAAGVSKGHEGTAHWGAFKRVSKKRLPIKQLYGPAVPKPLLRTKGAEFLNQEIDARLEARLIHELGRVIDQVKAAHGV